MNDEHDIMEKMAYSSEYDHDWDYLSPDKLSVFSAKRRKRCSSCGELINIGECVAEFDCYRHPKTLVEENIYGECGEVPLANRYLCKSCSEAYFSMRKTGGLKLIPPTENMLDLIKLQAQK